MAENGSNINGSNILDPRVWRRCSSCKKEIPYKSGYFTCSVSTCNQKPYNYVFCSVSCFERHLPIARHRDAAAINQKAPSYEEASAAQQKGDAGSAPMRRLIAQNSPGTTGSNTLPKEILIVVSKLKEYVKARADMNTSADVAEVLSEKVRRLCDDAIDQARQAGRKTLMDRDFK